MKLFSTLLVLTIIFAACSSSTPDKNNSEKEYANLASLSTPDTTAYDTSSVYVDSLNSIEGGLLISGNLPDGCSKLHEASHTMQNDSLNISLMAWKPSDKMCTQALTPFSFIYDDLSQQQITNAGVITINHKEYTVE